MNKKLITTLGTLALLGGTLFSCGEKPVEEPVIDVSITNKEVLGATWTVNDDDDKTRTVELKVTSTLGEETTTLKASDLVASGDIRLFATNNLVLGVDGLNLSLLKYGYSNLLVYYQNTFVDSVRINAEREYEIPYVTIAEAKEIIDSEEGPGTKVYEMSGVVTSIVNTYKEEYGNVAFWFENPQDPGNTFEAYGLVCTKELGESLKIGSHIRLQSQITKYGSTYETLNKEGTLLECSGGYNIVEVSVSEALAAGANLVEGSATRDEYVISGTIGKIVDTFGRFNEVTFELIDNNDATQKIVLNRVCEKNSSKLTQEHKEMFLEGYLMTVQTRLVKKGGAVQGLDYGYIKSITKQMRLLGTMDFTGGSSSDVTTCTNEQIKSVQNGMTFINDKGASKTNCRSSSTDGHIRLYDSSNWSVSSSDFSFECIKITFSDVSYSSKLATKADGSTSSEYKYSSDGIVGTIILPEAVSSFSMIKLNAQVRFTKIELWG